MSTGAWEVHAREGGGTADAPGRGFFCTLFLSPLPPGPHPPSCPALAPPRADLDAILELEPANRTVHADRERIRGLVTARDEKLKEEMMGKLKDLGNTALKWFGLSMDNFKAVQDPATGSYSISFQQNPGSDDVKPTS